MEFISYEPNNQFNDLNFKRRLHSDFDLCGFSNELQKGFLFFLGASLPIEFNQNGLVQSFPQNDPIENFSRCLNLYASSSGNFRDYGDLNDLIFTNEIYNLNYILHHLAKIDIDIDEKLKKIVFPTGSEFSIGDIYIDKNYVEQFMDSDYNLNTIHNLLENMFLGIGNHLHEIGYNYERSYEAGFAYYILQIQTDLEGFNYLISFILANLTPLYEALTQSFFLHLLNPKILQANHLISIILQEFYKGTEEIIRTPIHNFHQALFYENGTLNIKKEFDFEHGSEEELTFLTLLNATQFRNLVNIDDLRSRILEDADIIKPELCNKILSKTEFANEIFEIIYKKYMIRYDAPLGWNNRGDFLQFLVVLFYETCLYSVLVETIAE